MTMTWVYWDTFWSLAGSLVWFMTIGGGVANDV